jgi:hypothetical protein
MLSRTFAGEVEALKRYRTGGLQKVTVEHVTVNQGGQAIVGNVAGRGGGVSPKSKDQPDTEIARAVGISLGADKRPISELG